MATLAPDNDDKVRVSVKKTLETLLDHYWRAKNAQPSLRFDEVYALRLAYEDAVVEYAGLEGRLLQDEILSSDIDVTTFQKAEMDMKSTVETKAILMVAADFVKAMVSLA
ncbi:MAG: hypothetical protein V4772_25965 [Pseudomonadota bacterium]